MSSFTQRIPAANASNIDVKQTAADIFQILTGRSYSHLSRGKAGRYKEDIIWYIEKDIKSEKPATFFYDLGPGYHASLYPGQMDLSFDIGLAELFVLYQISEFSREVSKVYSRGTRFYIIIDNLCALATNDIPTEKTIGYCTALRSLIEETGIQQDIRLLVESEQFDESDYPRLEMPANTASNLTLSKEEIENVSRFVGRHCTMPEALARIRLYGHATEVTEKNLARLVTGVRLTQRATENTLGFRSFPGGDSRIQTGEIAITHDKKGKLRPTLLTSRNISEYDQYRFELPTGIPDSIQHLTYVKPARH
jgi:hypothetical protein